MRILTTAVTLSYDGMMHTCSRRLERAIERATAAQPIVKWRIKKEEKRMGTEKGRREACKHSNPDIRNVSSCLFLAVLCRYRILLCRCCGIAILYMAAFFYLSMFQEFLFPSSDLNQIKFVPPIACRSSTKRHLHVRMRPDSAYREEEEDALIFRFVVLTGK